jgi:hypothetical protein
MTLMASYAIDAGDRIVWTDEGFAGLAAEHGQAELAEDAVGRPLIDFVAGERPRALQRALIARARATPAKDPLELRYRCDSPAMRRFAVLQMAGQPDGGVVFTTWFEATEDRPYQPLLDRKAEHDGHGTVELCAWCNRVKTSDGWHEVEDLAPAAQADGRPPAVEDGLCEICELLLTTRPGAGPKWSGPYGRP